jgi:hypothetical protein
VNDRFNNTAVIDTNLSGMKSKGKFEALTKTFQMTAIAKVATLSSNF